MGRAWRVAGLARGRTGLTVELEDCYLLDVVHVPVAELRARGLRIVARAADRTRLDPTMVVSRAVR
jgi:hypothetical protein